MNANEFRQELVQVMPASVARSHLPTPAKRSGLCLASGYGISFQFDPVASNTRTIQFRGSDD